MNRKVLILASCFMLVAGIMVNAYVASADSWNKKTLLTTDQPLRVPGVTLPPGKYFFKVVDSGSNRNVVQVLSEDEKQIYATILALPNQRLHPTGDSQFAFGESPKGSPQMLRSWFYPGDSFGHEFVYSKSEIAMLAAQAKKQEPSAPAQTTSVQPAAQPSSEEQATPEPESPAIQQPSTYNDQKPPDTAEQGPVASAEPESPAYEPENAEPAQSAQGTEQQPATAQEPAPLPKTASPYPLLGLIGFLSLGGAYGFRAIRNRVS